MPTPVVATKVLIPPARPNLVLRPRLMRQLDGVLHCRLALVSAPAGFGKTTLVATWVREVRRATPALRAGWLSLDESDNDLARLLAYLVAALRQGDAPAGEQPFGRAHPLRRAAVEEALSALVNQIAQMAGGLVLVLDDYHVITAQAVHNALAWLVEHLPPQAHLVIATRADPPLPLARLRGRGELVEVRQADLRFTLDEAAGFLNGAMGLGLSASDVAALAARTEGWAAGLQMAAISLRGRDDTASFLKAFAGTHRHILDYLLEEVLQRQPPQVQSFLLRTSILDRLSGPLCDAILASRAPGEEVPAQATLEHLERNNLFVVPLDDERRWYRYHRLFADLLRRRLQQAEPGLMPMLHRRASAWHEQHGSVTDAIEHALAAADWERAAHLVEQASEATLMQSEVATLRRWVEALPEELVRARPSLALFRAWGLLLAGQPLAQVAAQLEGQSDRLPAGRMTALRAFGSLLSGQMSLAAELSRQALDALPESDTFWWAVAGWTQSVSRLGYLDLGARAQELGRLVQRSLEAGHLVVAASALCHLGELHMARGRLHEAARTYRRVLELARDPHGDPLPVASVAMIGLAQLHCEWNDLEAANAWLTRGIELSHKWAQTTTMEGHITLARVRHAEGDVVGARQAMEAAEDLARQSAGIDYDDRIVAMFQAQLAVAQGDVEAAGRWADARGKTDFAASAPPPDVADVGYRLRKYEHLVLARVRLAQRRPDDALALLEPLLSLAEGQGRGAMAIEVLLLMALAARQKGDLSGATSLLERALR
ncbi:MAG: tetratricopeptide repeat protein, partial [Anaerolineae bacterium]|nr:tetratricopeptide repeat protein [Anaerolineae bacterium]